MFGQNGSALFALALALFAPTRAFAKAQTFFTGTPLGIGILGGVENRPRSGFAAGTQTTSSDYASYVAAEPFLDFGNVVFRAHFGWHFYPLLSGSGNDSVGTFTESSAAGSFELGGRVELAPYLSEDARSRFYLVLGLNDSTIKLKNNRKFTSGTYAGQTLSDQVQGTATEYNVGLGFETFLIQNWSIAFEAGYAHRAADSFTYRTSTDLDGNTVSSGSQAKDSSGNVLGFHSYTPYGQVVLNLNL